MSLKDSALAVLQRNHERNKGATSDKKTMQLGVVKTPPKVAHVDLAIRYACKGLEISPTQFTAICNKDDMEYIAEGSFTPESLRAYARSFASAVQSRRIVFHPITGEFVSHG